MMPFQLVNAQWIREQEAARRRLKAITRRETAQSARVIKEADISVNF
jgi:hypothetical protein